MFRGRHAVRWHQEIEVATASYRRLNVGLEKPPYFPLIKLQEHTNTYLQRAGRLTTSEQDARLVALVTQHQNKDAAIAACAHALSPHCVRHLLRTELPADAHSRLSMSLYLRILVAARHANPRAVDELEAQCALSLISLLFPDVLTVGECLRKLFTFIREISIMGVPRDLLPPCVVENIPRNACELLSGQVQNMRFESEWKQAHQTTSWLSRLSGAARSIGELLDSSFPDWRIWALWRPDIKRLELWEQLTLQQRKDLVDILALEGPDFTGLGKSTLREALSPQGDDRLGYSISHGRLHLALESASISDAQRLLDRLVSILCTACSVSSSSTALFIHLCVHNSTNTTALQVLEHVNYAADYSLSKAVLDMFTAPVNSVRMSGVLGTIDALNDVHHQALRDVLSSQITAAAEYVLLGLQDKFCQYLQSGRDAETAGMNLHGFGKNLQAAHWLQPSLSERMQSLLRYWPSTGDMKGLFNIRSEAKRTTADGINTVKSMVDTYCMSYLAGHGTIDDEIRTTVEGLIRLWQQPPDRERREVAVAMAELSNVEPSIRRRCLIQLSSMTDRFVREIRTVVSRDYDEICIKFARVLVIPRLLDAEELDCWRGFLRCMIESRGSTLLDYTFVVYPTADNWLQWMKNIRTIFGSSRDDPPASSPILCQRLHHWTERLSRSYIPVLTSLGNNHGFESAMRWVLLGWEMSELIIPFLDAVNSPNERYYNPGIRPIIAQVMPDGGNIREIFSALLSFVQATLPGTHACLRVLNMHQKGSKNVTEAFLAAWLRDGQLVASDRRALEAIAGILRIQANSHGPVPADAVQEAVDLLNIEFDSIIDQSLRFESIRLTLMTFNSGRTSRMLRGLGMQDHSAARNSASAIPDSLVDVVEEISDGEFELLFPLNQRRPFQRTALGVGNARMLLVRLITGNGTKAPEFCIHLDPDGNGNPRSYSSGNRHTYCRVYQESSIPDASFCHGRLRRATYQLSRVLWRHLKTGFVSLDATYRLMAAAIENLANCCIVCGNSLGARMWRSTTCQRACSFALRKSSLEVRLADYSLDPTVVDLLLNIAHCAADSRDLDLLPGCPLNAASLPQTLQSLPRVSDLQQSGDITASIRLLGRQAESLLSWLCTSYRGFLASATGGLKVPGMAHVHQFVLANATPEIERAFAVHVTRANPTTRVVFHGTSVERLYLILRNGLQPGVGRWQRHGAAHGPGIYLADEPATALSFARASRSTWTSSGLDTCKIVLGVELAGSKPPVTPGIHVATDPSTVMVRYVFMFTRNAVAPIARHVAPAMQSAFASLRSGSA
jgi:hypothetical protein